MKNKIESVGVCDFCKSDIPHDAWYTKRGPRIYCSFSCRQIANSRNGAPVRGQKAHKKYLEGTWRNPADNMTAAQRHETAVKGGEIRAKELRQQVKEGTWKNPALSMTAKQKLSVARVITDPKLHSIIERMTKGCKVSDLSCEEADMYREYRRNLQKEKSMSVRRAANKRNYKKLKVLKEFGSIVIDKNAIPAKEPRKQKISKYVIILNKAAHLLDGQALKVRLQNEKQYSQFVKYNRKLNKPVKMQQNKLDLYIFKIKESKE